MIYVGIVLTKLNYFTATISSDGEIYSSILSKFTNGHDGFYTAAFETGTT